MLAEMRSQGADKTIAQIRKALEKKGMKYISSAFTLEEDVEARKFYETVSKLLQALKNLNLLITYFFQHKSFKKCI